ncbi:glutamate-1-semialdehyde 2,1-aminomutase [Candidatus Palauibacter sp.]|uniref:glutamate-1-semialdehyde 2,1-aminomutase n=1 Tax=Candidatus Palauibacter sp. TaxID=3101350 RepID=UPI003B012543
MSAGPRQPEGASDWVRRARAVMPGGVSSPVRAFGPVGLPPLFAARGEGARIFDDAGRGYLDYVLSWGPLILGHAAPPVVEAVTRAARDGMSFGACHAREVELAERLAAWVPGVEMVRFVNSGTEATMSAVRLARAATGRDLILKFEGCYHGHADGFLVVAGSGVATLSLPDSPGVPAATSALTLTAPYNDLEAVDAVLAEHGPRLAAVIVEPVAGNAGLIPPRKGFLQGLRDACDRAGALLIFDEVMTGFRVARGGAQERYGVTPDLTTLGKVVGAGLPVAAYAGPRDLMRRVAPEGPVYQAGTLSGNPLGMAAGLAQLEELERTDPFAALERRASTLVEGILTAARSRGIPACGTAIGSMWGVFFTEGPVVDFDGARRADTELFARYYRACFERGVFFAPSAFEAGFLSTAHTEADIENTVAVADEAMDAALAGAN